MSINKLNGGINMTNLLNQVYGIRDSFWDPESKTVCNSFFNTDWTDVIDALTQEKDAYKQRNAHALVEDNENEVHIVVDVPGFSKDELSVEYHQDELIIIAQHKDTQIKDESVEKEGSKKHILKKFKLSSELDSEKASIKLEHGQLKIVIPRLEDAKPKQFPIQ